MNFLAAKNIAMMVGKQLSPFCDIIHVAGSIRRRKPEVKDIELCCIPKVVMKSTGDLFGTTEPGICDDFIKTINSLGTVVKGKPTGRMMQIDLPAGIRLDLFLPIREDYYRQYAIRTGSSDYSWKVIAMQWKRMGWVGTDDGLRRASECINISKDPKKSDWQCRVKNPILPPVWKSENEFFEWLKLPYIDPAERYI